MAAPTVSLAGVWMYSDSPTQSLIPFYDTFRSSLFEGEGLAMGGWAYNPSNNTLFKTNIALVTPGWGGALKLNTDVLVDSNVSNGVGAVLAYDFNRDGFDDLFFPQYNETPFFDLPSLLLLSRSDGTYSRQYVEDLANIHGATVAEGGIVVTAGYSQTYDGIYEFNSTLHSLEVRHWNSVAEKFYGATSASLNDFNNDGRPELVLTDVKFAPGVDFDPNSEYKIQIYSANNYELGLRPLNTLTPYFNKPGYESGMYANSPSHAFRNWVDDFNHDGLDDLLVGVSTYGSAIQNSKLQMFQNLGQLRFEDVTDSFGSSFSIETSQLDYSMQIKDIDGSGIDSYLLSSYSQSKMGEGNGNYLLVNDGTGQLHVALHDEFVGYAQLAMDFARDNHLAFNSYFNIPSFIGILDSDSRLNYLVQFVSYANEFNSTNENPGIPLLNFAIDYDLTTAFTDSIVIDDRNQSLKIRTFSGDDVIYSNGKNSSAAQIDTGFGVDRVLYDVSSHDVFIEPVDSNESTQGFSIRVLALDGSVYDELRNAERFEFVDRNIALDLHANAGQVAKLLGAVFGADSVGNAEYVGIGLDLLDAGMSYTDLAALAVSVTGKSSSTDVCTLLWENVIGTPATSADIAPFKAMLDSGQLSIGQLTTLAADTSFNTENIDLVGLSQTGLEYL